MQLYVCMHLVGWFTEDIIGVGLEEIYDAGAVSGRPINGGRRHP